MRSETQALLLCLAWAQKDCPGDGVAGRGGSVEHSLCHCTRCDDTGKVFLFPDEVRVECKQIHNLFNQEGSSSSIRSASCSEVGCRGWIPSTDPMVWLVAAEAEGYITALVSDDNGHWAAIGGGAQPVPKEDKPGIPWTTLDLQDAVWKDDPFEAILYALEAANDFAS